MEIILYESFDGVDDPVKTEYLIHSQLIEKKELINTNYVYVSLPLASNINTKGILYTQNLINHICRLHQDKKLFFVCQHILVKDLNFHNNLVFTPHATVTDNFIPIPHHSCNYDLEYVKEWKDRKYTFSFIGSFTTHPVRQKIYEHLKDRDDCLILDSGVWHFYNNAEKQTENKRRYIEVLGDTKYSLCPRGTGPSTIRIWEAMAMGSCPIILSDFLKMPLERHINSNLWKKHPENFNTLNFGSDSYINQDYFRYFSNDNLCLSIVKAVEGL